jgi:CheY-like chemotaxis protein
MAFEEIQLKILIVDQQDSHYLRSMVDLLNEGGFNVDFCFDPETTYRKLKNSVRPVDLLIIDLECMHETDGFLFLKALKEQEFCRGLKIIITTNSVLDPRLSSSQNELGIHAFFNKARFFEELFYIVADIVPPGGHNQRKSRRVPVRFLVNYLANEKARSYYANNLSRDGIFVKNAQADPVGTVANLSFNLPGDSLVLQAKAKVVRALRYPMDVSSLRYETFPPGNGLVFTEMQEEHRRSLIEFVAREEARVFGSRGQWVEGEEKGPTECVDVSGF